VLPCSLVLYEHFGGMYCFHLRASKSKPSTHTAAAKVVTSRTNGTAYQNARKSIHIKGAAYILSNQTQRLEYSITQTDSPAMYYLVEGVFPSFEYERRNVIWKGWAII
jgi:hypothetical protein